jgi:endonuclease YncB( thermonuclease family)
MSINMYEYTIKRLLKVVDGDTIKVEIDLGFDMCVTATVRLAGIDTPESRTKDLKEKQLGLDAKHWLETILNPAGIEKGTHLVRIHTAKDNDEKYGRLLGTLYTPTETQSINQLMVEHGYAWAYDGGTKKKNLQELLEIRTLRGTINDI